jgi:hypothetical protein
MARHALAAGVIDRGYALDGELHVVDGVVFGTAWVGGTANNGTVFAIRP